MEKKNILVIPYLPPSELSPNARVHWFKKYQAAQKLKEDVFYLAKQAAIPRFTTATLQFTFVVPNSRRRDPDNYLAMMKPVADALVLADVLPDDNFSVVSYAPVLLQIESKGNSRTIVEIWGKRERDKLWERINALHDIKILDPGLSPEEEKELGTLYGRLEEIEYQERNRGRLIEDYE